MLLIIGRTFKESLKNLRRNISLNIASVSILSLSLYVMSLFLMVFMISQLIIKNFESKVSISVYFKSETPEENILAAQSDLRKMVEISSVDYVSKDAALDDF